MDITESPITSLSFLEYLGRIETLILEKCVKIPDNEFVHLHHLKRLDSLYVRYTQVTPRTLARAIESPVLHIDAANMVFNLDDFALFLRHTSSLQGICVALAESVNKADLNELNDSLHNEVS